MKSSPFRSIRQKLFNEGKLLRYLGYAIGEIALIIIGIMLALQLNNWNEDRKTQAEFEQYIVKLKGDVAKAVQNAKRMAMDLEENATKSNWVLECLKKAEFEPGELGQFEQALVEVGQYAEPQIKVGLLGKLLDGETEIISRNSHLADEALKLESSTEFNLGILRNLREELARENTTVHQYRGMTTPILPKLRIQYNIDELRSSSEFQYATQNIISMLGTSSLFSNNIAEDLEAFLAVLEEY